MTENKKKRGRPPGSGKKQVVLSPPPEKPIILNGPVFDEGRIQKRINELVNHIAITFEEIPYPSNWDSLNTVCRLMHRIRAKREREGKPEIKCPCGTPIVSHRGWCAHRLANSPSRQEFLKSKWNVLL